MSDYLKTAEEVYTEAAETPWVGLCCTTAPTWQLPGLNIPGTMLEMNYGCGTTVHPGDLVKEPTILYVGVGGGMELLQFAYFSRRRGSVIGVDPVERMLARCNNNLIEAEELNAWFRRDFVELRTGNALSLPVDDETVDVAAQNCLFNIFKETELRTAVAEMYRVLKPGGRLVMSDPTCEKPIPDALRNDARLRALCLSGAIPIKEYIQTITDAGFGTVEVRARRPYRVLDPEHYGTDEVIYVESLEVCALKDPIPDDGPCVFTGKTAIYFGDQEYFDDDRGHILMFNQPSSVCDKTAAALVALERDDIFISSSTWFYDGGGCC